VRKRVYRRVFELNRLSPRDNGKSTTRGISCGGSRLLSLLITLMPHGGTIAKSRNREIARAPSSLLPARSVVSRRPLYRAAFKFWISAGSCGRGTGNRGQGRGRGRQRVLSRPSLVAYCIIQICPEKNTRLNFKGMKKSTNEHTASPSPPVEKSRFPPRIFKVAPISVRLCLSEIYICPVSREFASRPVDDRSPFVSCSISLGNPSVTPLLRPFRDFSGSARYFLRISRFIARGGGGEGTRLRLRFLHIRLIAETRVRNGN